MSKVQQQSAADGNKAEEHLMSKEHLPVFVRGSVQKNEIPKIEKKKRGRPIKVENKQPAGGFHDLSFYVCKFQR